MTPAPALNPLLGTWKITQVESSRPELPHMESGTQIISEDNAGYRYHSSVLYSHGKEVTVDFVTEIDGVWRSVTGSQVADTLCGHILEDGSLEFRFRKGGIEAGSNRSSVSADGKTLTTIYDLPVPDGSAVQWIVTCQRQ